MLYSLIKNTDIKEQTNFLVDVLVESMKYNDINTIELIVSNIDELDSHKIYLILSLLEYNNMHRYEIFKILNEKINALTMKDLADILLCFNRDEYKYEIFVRLINKCLPSSDYSLILSIFQSESLKIDINKIIKKVKDEFKLGKVLSELNSFDPSERIELLQESIAGTEIELKNADLYCKILKDILGDQYEDGCLILGIDPEKYKRL